MPIIEAPAENYMRGGQHRQPGTPPPTASSLVQAYLSAMENRDLGTATEYLADGFHMTFPGNQRFNTLEQLVNWASRRYRSISKTYQRFDEATDETGMIVYCYGTLAGEWLNGETFSDIRFIDRFLVQNGKLLDQQVWNDLAESQLER